MKKFIICCIATVLFFQYPAFAAPVKGKKQTVGELLKRAREESRGSKVQQMQKSDVNVPDSQFNFQKREAVDLGSVKPPRSTEIMKVEVTGDQAEYEKTLDKQIQELYKLTRKFENNPNRGELWLRLAELYVEKATLVDARKQDLYDQQLAQFQSGKTKVKPKLDLVESRDYNKKAIQLYEWFLRDYPKDEKTSQALFFLGYNYFELGDTKKGSFYYDQLTQKFPKSPFVGEAHFALGEYHFENERWVDAYKQYAQLIKDKRHRLHTFSMYKGGWCLFRMGKTEEAIKYMDFIIRMGKQSNVAMGSATAATKKAVNKSRLENEALRDIVVFFADLGDTQRAIKYFESVAGNERKSYLEKLAYYFGDKGNREASRDVFHYLIKSDPNSKKAFEYQYQVVQNYFYAKNSPQFKEELYRWINDYRKGSNWSVQNESDKAFIENVYKLREQTLRNYILQQHQTAQNSRAKYSQQTALDGYSLYFQEFADSPNAADMRFFYGEILYDMAKYEEAATQYTWVAENAPQSKYGAKASQNLLLSIEKALPKEEEMQKRVGDSIEPIPMDPRVEKFIKSASWYLQKFPTTDKAPDIKFRMGRLYYQTNNFGPAEKLFKEIVEKYPKTKFSEYSANLILDIYNLKKDYDGLEKVGTELLAYQSISDSKAGSDIRGVLEKANFKKAQDLEVSKNYLASAEQFQAFVAQNPKSELVSMALFNAGVNFERAGKIPEAIANYKKLQSSKDKNADALKLKSKKLLAKLYQDTGRFEESAQLFKQLAQENPKDPLVANYIYNAAVMFESTGKTKESADSYMQYTEINKNQKENLDIIFKVAEMHRKAGQKNLALQKFKLYADQAPESAKKVEAYYWIFQITKADEAKQKALATYQRIGKDSKEASARFVADFKFMEAEKTFKQLKSISIPADPARQKKAVDQKLDLVTQLTAELGEIIKLNTAEEIVKSLNLLGMANEHMADAITGAPAPGGLNDEQKKQYAEGIAKIVEPFLKKAQDSYKLAVERGSDLEVYNEGYLQSLQKMNAKDPKSFPLGQEINAETKKINWIGE